MSAPAEKALSPAPVSTTARTSRERRTSRTARASSRSVAASRAFSAAGRSSVTVTTASVRTTTRLAKPSSATSVLRSPIEAMVRLDHPHRAGRRTHDDRVRDGAALHVAHAGQVVARRDPGGGEHHGPRGELVESVLPPEVEEAEGTGLRRLLLVARLEPRLHLATQADQRRRGEDALRGPADAHQDVDAGFHLGGRQCRRDVAAADQLDAR